MAEGPTWQWNNMLTSVVPLLYLNWTGKEDLSTGRHSNQTSCICMERQSRGPKDPKDLGETWALLSKSFDASAVLKICVIDAAVTHRINVTNSLGIDAFQSGENERILTPVA